MFLQSVTAVIGCLHLVRIGGVRLTRGFVLHFSQRNTSHAKQQLRSKQQLYVQQLLHLSTSVGIKKWSTARFSKSHFEDIVSSFYQKSSGSIGALAPKSRVELQSLRRFVRLPNPHANCWPGELTMPDGSRDHGSSNASCVPEKLQ